MAAALWLALSALGVLLVMLLWRYGIAADRARRRRRGRGLFTYLTRR